MLSVVMLSVIMLNVGASVYVLPSNGRCNYDSTNLQIQLTSLLLNFFSSKNKLERFSTTFFGLKSNACVKDRSLTEVEHLTAIYSMSKP